MATDKQIKALQNARAARAVHKAKREQAKQAKRALASHARLARQNNAKHGAIGKSASGTVKKAAKKKTTSKAT
ncbi:hypothetical protein C8034_v009842 [Colletotrichum sidae]|uniref:Uncharacterized protein n=1 Tax=Colletotrichum sidae TaxID=1347389 RepID=A0A4R8T1K5_9PEZI|nr:hypothetical protein C8034_v009842 [Colletotrichum sidae]